MYIPVNRIIVNKQKIDEEHVDEFVEYLERGRRTKPILVRKHDYSKCVDLNNNPDLVVNNGQLYVLVDGRHRLAAHKILGKEMIECIVTL